MCAQGTQQCAEGMGVYTSNLRLHLCNYVPYFQVHSLAGNRSGMSCTDTEVTDTLTSHDRLTLDSIRGQLDSIRVRRPAVSPPTHCDQNLEEM